MLQKQVGQVIPTLGQRTRAAVAGAPDLALTPGERSAIERLIAAVRARRPGLKRVVVFGSRARGFSHERSDLDVAVYFQGAPDAATEAAVAETAAHIEVETGMPIHAVCFFSSERPTPIGRVIEREGITVWQA